MKKKNLIIIGLILVLGVIAGSFWYWKSRNEKVTENKEVENEELVGDKNKDVNQENTQLNQKPEVINSSQFNFKGWKTYRNKNYNFEVKYPPNWIYSEGNYLVGFDTHDSVPGGPLFGIFFENPDNLEKLISGMGNQFSDRKEERKKVELNGIEGLMVTVTTNELKIGEQYWISKNIYFVKDGTLFIVGANTEYKGKSYPIYASFRFID